MPTSPAPTDLFVVVMGVAGCGKSTVGGLLASQLDAAFLDADDLHPPANVEKMRRGDPLQDEDRWAWLDAVGHEATTVAHAVGGVVVACSALRRAHRDVLRLHGATHLVHLTADPAVIRARLADRPGHFAGPSLLDSQLATLEPPTGEGALLLDVGELDAATAAVRAAGWVEADRPT